MNLKFIELITIAETEGGSMTVVKAYVLINGSEEMSEGNVRGEESFTYYVHVDGNVGGMSGWKYPNTSFC